MVSRRDVDFLSTIIIVTFLDESNYGERWNDNPFSISADTDETNYFLLLLGDSQSNFVTV